VLTFIVGLRSIRRSVSTSNGEPLGRAMEAGSTDWNVTWTTWTDRSVRYGSGSPSARGENARPSGRPGVWVEQGRPRRQRGHDAAATSRRQYGATSVGDSGGGSGLPQGSPQDHLPLALRRRRASSLPHREAPEVPVVGRGGMARNVRTIRAAASRGPIEK
jgi:hypothetical protein